MWVLTLRQYLVDAHPGIGMLLELVQKLVGSQHLLLVLWIVVEVVNDLIKCL